MKNTNSRRQLQEMHFPHGVPRLWSPSLTHFLEAKEPDAKRIRAHLEHLSPYVKGILVPGSTGEGWEMSNEDIRTLLSIVLDIAQEFGIRVLVGVLKTNAEEVLACLDSMEDTRTHPAFAGVTICPPKGSELTQASIQLSVSRVLRRGWPTALYQLPQVTQNEMTAETIAALANEFQNFILFKDTSGTDKVAMSGLDFDGVFMVRGAEKGGYAAWHRKAGGPYDGFLLSTANVFSKQLDDMLKLIDVGGFDAAEAISEKLELVVEQAFSLVSEFPVGNAFANTNKVLDHCMAFGDQALQVAPPLLYSGTRLPMNFIENASNLLRQYSLLPERGYY